MTGRRRSISISAGRRVAALLVAIMLLAVVANVSPQLGGPDLSPVGTVSASHTGGTHIDDFEDGDLSPSASGWEGWHGDTGGLAVESDDPIKGSYSGNVTSTNEILRVHVNNSNFVSPSRVSVRVRPDSSAMTGNNDDALKFSVINESVNQLVQVRFTGSGHVEVREGGAQTDTGFDWTAGKEYHIELRNIDYSSANFDLVINNFKLGTYSFDRSDDRFNKIRVGLDTSNSGAEASAVFDNIVVGGTGSDIHTFEQGLTQDYEDGDYSISNTGWDGWTGDTGSLEVQSATVISGSYSAKFTTTGASQSVSLETNDFVTNNVTRIEVKVQVGEYLNDSKSWTEFSVLGSDGADTFLRVRLSDNATQSVDTRQGGGVGWTDTGATWSVGTTHTIVISDIQYDDNTYDLSFDGQQLWDDRGFDVPGTPDNFDTIRLRNEVNRSGDTRHTYFDDLHAGCVGTSDCSGSALSTVSGTVVNQNGDPVEGATVELWQIKDSKLDKYPGETTSQAAREVVDNVTRSVPRDRFDASLDPINGEQFTGEGAGRMVLVHEPSAWLEPNNVNVLGEEVTVYRRVTRELNRPLIQLEPDEPYTFSIWNRGKDPLYEDAIDRKVEPGVSASGTIVIEQIGPGNSTIQRIEKETEDQVSLGLTGSTLGKSHEYVELSLPTGYYLVRPKQGGQAIPIRVGSPETIPRHFNKDLKDVDGKVAEIAKTTRAEIDAGTFKRVTVRTDSSGQFSYDVPAGYSTVALTAFDGQGLTDGITDPTLEDLRTQIQQQEYNGSIYLSSSPKVVEPPKSGITLTMVEIKRPTFGDLESYLGLLDWLDEKLNEEAFARLSTLWNDNRADVSKEDLEQRAEELTELAEQNDELRTELERLVEENEDLTESVEELESQLEDGELSRTEVEALLEDAIQAAQSQQPTVTIVNEPPEYELPETDSEPTLLNLRLPVNTRAGETSELTEAGVSVLVHFDNGSSTTMPSSYWSIDNSLGASQGTGSEIVIEDYPIPADVAVASIEVLVANDAGVGRTEVSVENPAFEGTPPELASINPSTVRPGPSETVSLTVTPTESSTYQEVAGATVYGPNGSELSTTLTDNKVSFTTSGEGSHLVKLTVSDGSHNYTETIRLKAGEESLDWPASVRVHNGVLGKTLIASDGVKEAELDVARGGSVAQITAKVDDSDVPSEIHLYGKEITGIQQDVTVSVVSSSDESQITRPIKVTLHLSRIAEGALVRSNSEPISESGNRFGKVTNNADSTTVISVTEGGSATVSINNNPSLLARADYWVDKNVGQRLPDFSLAIPPPIGGGSMGVLTA